MRVLQQPGSLWWCFARLSHAANAWPGAAGGPASDAERASPPAFLGHATPGLCRDKGPLWNGPLVWAFPRHNLQAVHGESELHVEARLLVFKSELFVPDHCYVMPGAFKGTLKNIQVLS